MSWPERTWRKKHSREKNWFCYLFFFNKNKTREKTEKHNHKHLRRQKTFFFLSLSDCTKKFLSLRLLNVALLQCWTLPWEIFNVFLQICCRSQCFQSERENCATLRSTMFPSCTLSRSFSVRADLVGYRRGKSRSWFANLNFQFITRNTRTKKKLNKKKAQEKKVLNLYI